MHVQDNRDDWSAVMLDHTGIPKEITQVYKKMIKLTPSLTQYPFHGKSYAIEIHSSCSRT